MAFRVINITKSQNQLTHKLLSRRILNKSLWLEKNLPKMNYYYRQYRQILQIKYIKNIINRRTILLTLNILPK